MSIDRMALEREACRGMRDMSTKHIILMMKGILTAAYEYIAKRVAPKTRINMNIDDAGGLPNHREAIFVAVKKSRPQVVISVTGRFPDSPAVRTQRSVIIIESAMRAKAVPPMERAPLAKKLMPRAQSTIETRLFISMDLPTNGLSAARRVTKMRLARMATESSCLRDKLDEDHSVGVSNPDGKMVLLGATSIRKFRTIRKDMRPKAQSPLLCVGTVPLWRASRMVVTIPSSAPKPTARFRVVGA